MRPGSCRPINCRSSQHLSVSCAEPHPLPPTAGNPDGAAAQADRLPEAPPTLQPQNAAPNSRPSAEHRPTSPPLPDKSFPEPPKAHRADDDRNGIPRNVESRLAIRETQSQSRQCEALSCNP